MKSFLLAIAVVQILHCSGVPRTKEALRASVIKLNEITEIPNLCGISRRGVTNTYRTGKLSYKVDLTFSVKETVCSKNSSLEFDDPTCLFRPKKIAEKGFCKSHVEFFADKVADVDVECDGLKTVDSASNSLESSETSFEVEKKSNETAVEEVANVKNQTTEASLMKPLNVEIESIELSQEDHSNEQNDKSRGRRQNDKSRRRRRNDKSRGRRRNGKSRGRRQNGKSRGRY
ncbi:secreted phosphoprotein 24-like [Hemitrygon akajei]|uniref:secreted phosphoprotein 24-like n=1 Tax=Hemitrygon akajei TaxID=2704970 RepID=UPI003BF98D6B